MSDKETIDFMRQLIELKAPMCMLGVADQFGTKMSCFRCGNSDVCAKYKGGKEVWLLNDKKDNDEHK